jgi:hypothetical protein
MGNFGWQAKYCIRGHELTPENTYNLHGAHAGRRLCKECVRIRRRKSQERVKGKLNGRR